jgi:glucose-1-phosphatase
MHGRGWIVLNKMDDLDNKIKVIIFDLGGVVVPEKGQYIAEKISLKLGVSVADYNKAVEKFKDKTTSGEISLLEMYDRLVNKLSSSVDSRTLFDKHLDLYQETSTSRNFKMLELIGRLKRNYKVVCLTNTEREIMEFNRNIGLFDLFDKAYVSHVMGCKKPDCEIYKEVLEDLNLRSNEVLFIDNDQSYIDGAEGVGIPCVLFIGYDELVEELKDRDIDL